MGVESPNRTAAPSPLTTPFVSARRIAGKLSGHRGRGETSRRAAMCPPGRSPPPGYARTAHAITHPYARLPPSSRRRSVQSNSASSTRFAAEEIEKTGTAASAGEPLRNRTSSSPPGSRRTAGSRTMARGRNPLSVVSIAAPLNETARIPSPRRALTTQSKNRESWLTTSTDRITTNLRTGERDARANRDAPPMRRVSSRQRKLQARRCTRCGRDAMRRVSAALPLPARGCRW